MEEGREGGSQARKKKHRALHVARAAAAAAASDVSFSTDLLLAYNSKLLQLLI